LPQSVAFMAHSSTPLNEREEDMKEKIDGEIPSEQRGPAEEGVERQVQVAFALDIMGVEGERGREVKGQMHPEASRHSCGLQVG
jgi:hypothetical protein